MDCKNQTTEEALPENDLDLIALQEEVTCTCTSRPPYLHTDEEELNEFSEFVFAT